MQAHLPDTLSILQSMSAEAPDLIIRKLQIKASGVQAILSYMEAMSDRDMIQNNVLHPLMHEGTGDFAIGDIVTIGSVDQADDWAHVNQAILQGKSVLFQEGKSCAAILDTSKPPQRAILDSQVEKSIKGAHQGFIETGSTNIALIRKLIPSRELKVKEIDVGARGSLKVSLLYLDDVANPEVLQEFEDRIRQIEIDSVSGMGELEELIEDDPYSPFPQFLTSERPDTVAPKILEGRIAIVLEGSPSVMMGPASFVNFFQNIDDYTMGWQLATFMRLLRFTAFFVAVLLPAVYIAVISFNFEVIPLQLLLSVGASRSGVPFSPLMEALIMEFTLELLKEAGIRLPAPIGQTVGILGAIVIGQATVQAGIVSNIMVIVVSLTGLSSYIIPNTDMSSAVRLIRFPMMLLASFFGLMGVGIGMMVLLGHLITLESLGTPYFSPLSPVRFADWKDAFIRFPLWNLDNRPLNARPKQLIRQRSKRSKGDGE
ncbi:spore gernimation protein [Paenibacillus pectinilyticus]|uniref:Spore gernimation protein n=1 Tax=Paenibacillus pectinilyticus TaxID=512399 RepID=A0A1C1A5D5_9BACL|nr:spore gernimation protein [Paenibacillus pectinilyticus]